MLGSLHAGKVDGIQGGDQGLTGVLFHFGHGFQHFEAGGTGIVGGDGPLDTRDDGFHHGQVAEIGIRGVDDAPGRIVAVCQHDGPGRGTDHTIVICGDLLVGWRKMHQGPVLLTLFERAGMVLFVEMEPELDNGHPGFRQPGFQGLPAMHAGGEFVFSHILAAALPHGLTIPAVIKDRRLSGSRKLPPEAPGPGTGLLFVGHQPENMVLHMLAVHPLRQKVDDGAASGTDQTGHRDQDGDLALDALQLSIEKTHAQLGGFFFKFFVTACSAKGCRFKHSIQPCSKCSHGKRIRSSGTFPALQDGQRTFCSRSFGTA